ncbi:MAG: nucleoside triphosphate pyrophosphohydrolase [Candidatus Rifleibacteriota bacterium]
MTNDKKRITQQVIRLVEILEILRSPEGCSWDRKQTCKTLAPNIIEEAEEVVEAIDSEDTLHIVEELGDLLMLIVFNSQIGSENGTFSLAEVAEGICNKLVLRHPHVFADEDNNIKPEQVMDMWGKIKAVEKVERSRLSNRMKEALKFPSAIKLTEKIQSEAATVGFDFPDTRQAFDKIEEEIGEVKENLEESEPKKEKIEEEIGDLLFSVINFTRLNGIDAENCLKRASEKFVARFVQVEKLAENDGGFEGKTLQELDKYWDKIKLE